MGSPMNTEPNSDDARRSLREIESGRTKVIAEIRMPSWYWWGLAIAWIALGVVTDIKNPWLTAFGTLAFGAGHAAIAHSLLGGRRGNAHLSVRRDVAGRFTPLVVIISLLVFAGLTIVGAIIATDKNAPHPVTLASIGVAVVIVLGGPQLMSIIRHRAAKRLRHA
jgi:hypothetical protein